MEFLRRRKVTIDGHEFEVREVSIAMRREIELAQSQGADFVAETLRRCVYYNGQALGDDAVNLGYSFATPLVTAIKDLAEMGSVPLELAPVPVPAETPAVAPNGNGEAVIVPKD